jgi:hypothetical protein
MRSPIPVANQVLAVSLRKRLPIEEDEGQSFLSVGTTVAIVLSPNGFNVGLLDDDHHGSGGKGIRLNPNIKLKS